MSDVGLWLRWAILHGFPRAFLAAQARRGEPMARLLIGPLRGGDPEPLTEEIRARGRLTRTPFVAVTADHELCRAILRDDRFGASNPANMNLPKPARWLISRTDPQLPNPAEPPSMLVVDPTRPHPLPARRGACVYPSCGREIADPDRRDHQ